MGKGRGKAKGRVPIPLRIAKPKTMMKQETMTPMEISRRRVRTIRFIKMITQMTQGGTS